MCPKARGSVSDVHFIELDPPAECISIDDQSQDNIRGGSGQERARYLGPTAAQHARGAAILPQAPHRVSRRSPLGRQQHVTILSPTRSIWSPVSSPRISVAFRRRLDWWLRAHQPWSWRELYSLHSTTATSDVHLLHLCVNHQAGRMFFSSWNCWSLVLRAPGILTLSSSHVAVALYSQTYLVYTALYWRELRNDQLG